MASRAQPESYVPHTRLLTRVLQPTIRAINSLCVVRGVREVDAGKWPSSGLCYRGGGLPDSARGFFSIGVQALFPSLIISLYRPARRCAASISQ